MKWSWSTSMFGTRGGMATSGDGKVFNVRESDDRSEWEASVFASQEDFDLGEADPLDSEYLDSQAEAVAWAEDFGAGGAMTETMTTGKRTRLAEKEDRLKQALKRARTAAGKHQTWTWGDYTMVDELVSEIRVLIDSYAFVLDRRLRDVE